MRILNVQQGSAEWSAVRAQHNTASEAPIVMGASKYSTRAELLRQKASGVTPEVDAHKQALFDRGHAAEAGMRVIVEEMIGDDLSPITAVCEETGLLASLDGATMMGDLVFEGKLWNEDLATQVLRGELDPHYFWQLEQQLCVTKAEKVIFAVGDGTREKFVSMEYRAVPGRREALIAAWRQFDADLAAYQPEPAAEAAPVGRAPESLPALRIEVTGMVTASNLDAFKATALGAIRSVNRELSTDRQFADAEQAVKWCGDVEERLKAAKQHALSQTESIDALFRAIDEIGAEARTVRLELEKLVKARKEAIRGEIVAAGVAALRAHTDALTARIGKPYLPVIAADFGGKIKGLKSVSSIRDAVDGELARAKIHASAEADRIEVNLKMLGEVAAGYRTLFADVAQLVLKAPDDCRAVAVSRIADHQAAEAKREEETRERIRAEEAAKLQREQEARDRETARQAAEAAKPAPTPAPVVIAAPAAVSQAPNVVPMQRTAAPAEAATLKLGEINARLGFTMTAEFVGSLGVVGVRDRSAMLYRESQFQTLCDALLRHVTQVAQSELAAA